MSNETDPWSDEYLEESEQQEFECDAKITNAFIEKRTIERTGEDATYLMLELTPTSYQGDALAQQYRITNQQKSKWIHFQRALREVGAKVNNEKELIGKEYHWRRKHISKFTNSDGEEVVVSAMVPTGLPGGKVKPSKGEMDGDQGTILDWVKANGGGTNSDIAKGTGLKMPSVVKTVNQLKIDGKLVVEEGVIMLAE